MSDTPLSTWIKNRRSLGKNSISWVLRSPLREIRYKCSSSSLKSGLRRLSGQRLTSSKSCQMGKLVLRDVSTVVDCPGPHYKLWILTTYYMCLFSKLIPDFCHACIASSSPIRIAWLIATPTNPPSISDPPKPAPALTSRSTMLPCFILAA